MLAFAHDYAVIQMEIKSFAANSNSMFIEWHEIMLEFWRVRPRSAFD